MRALTTSLCNISGGLYQQFSAWVTLFDSTSPAERDFLANRITYTPLKKSHENDKKQVIDLLEVIEMNTNPWGSCYFYYDHQSCSIFDAEIRQTLYGLIP